MIYAGTTEMPVYLGADEIPAIYVGSEQIYPYSISGFTVKPLTLSFPKAGGAKSIRIVSEYSWTASTADAWLTLSANSGASGRTTLTVTAVANETGEELTGSITITASDPTYSATVAVTQETSPIPAAYQELQYIEERAGNYAYITTNILMNSDMWFEFKIRPTANPSTPEKHIFSGDVFQAARVLANNTMRTRRGGSASINPIANVYTWGSDTTFVLFKKNNNVVANGTTIGSFAPAEPYVDTTPGWFFSWKETDPSSTGNNFAMVGYLYYFIIGSNTTGQELYHFTPVKRLSDNEVGLYETVNGVFYGPANSKKFTAGPVVQ